LGKKESKSKVIWGTFESTTVIWGVAPVTPWCSPQGHTASGGVSWRPSRGEGLTQTCGDHKLSRLSGPITQLKKRAQDLVIILQSSDRKFKMTLSSIYIIYIYYNPFQCILCNTRQAPPSSSKLFTSSP
jgi:hypothetical protein